MPSLVESVPNFSEGRDRAKVDAIVEAMHLNGVYVLGQEMDADHNRSVITLAGVPEAIQEAVVRGVGKAAELIDLNLHKGVHPRLGATDVAPFIPLEGITLEECVVIARRAGEEIWKRYRIPVYLYETAAVLPERRNLEDIRRGQFEGLRGAIANDPARKPDFGDAAHATAGAVAVGARKFLIAYNIFLDTADVEVAKRVARAVRTSGGGLKFVKASGFLARGLAQVSMNLTDFEQTSMRQVFTAVKREAAKYEVAIRSSELIGLVPRKALEPNAVEELQIENFQESRILENCLAAVRS
jgi:glutamate formiminotransferase